MEQEKQNLNGKRTNNMTKDESMWARMTAILAVVLIVALFILSIVAEQRNVLKEEAVKLNYAEWIEIGVNEPEFKWKQKQ
jgi:preprotein translocase subunit SecG